MWSCFAPESNTLRITLIPRLSRLVFWLRALEPLEHRCQHVKNSRSGDQTLVIQNCALTSSLIALIPLLLISCSSYSTAPLAAHSHLVQLTAHRPGSEPSGAKGVWASYAVKRLRVTLQRSALRRTVGINHRRRRKIILRLRRRLLGFGEDDIGLGGEASRSQRLGYSTDSFHHRRSGNRSTARRRGFGSRSRWFLYGRVRKIPPNLALSSTTPNLPFFARTGFHPGGSTKSAKQRRTGRHCHFFGRSATGFDRGVPEPGWKLQRVVDQGERFFELSYLPSEDFRVTDCAALSHGDVIVLERRYVPFGILSARLKLVRGETVQPGAKLLGEELLQLEYPLNVDNFEGIAVQEDPSNGTIIYLVSDDNYNPFQRTLLFQFRLANK